MKDRAYWLRTVQRRPKYTQILREYEYIRSHKVPTDSNGGHHGLSLLTTYINNVDFNSSTLTLVHLFNNMVPFAMVMETGGPSWIDLLSPMARSDS